MRDELDSYLGMFSMGESIPSSLSGYGLGAQQSTASKPKPRVVAYPPRQPAGSGNVTPAQTSAVALQDFLNALQSWVPKSGRYDDATRTAWAQYVKVFREPHANISALMVDKLSDPKHVYITAQALKRLSDKAAASGNLRAETARKIGSTPDALLKTKQVSKPVVAGNTKPAATGYTLSTAAVQDVLIRLGWKGKGTTKGAISKDLTDGLYGSTVASLWTQSAKKRSLDPNIAKASTDGKQVRVVENTFLMLKAAADLLVPPQAGQASMVAPTSATTTVPQTRFVEVLVRLTGSPQGSTAPWDVLVQKYQGLTKAGGYDTRVAQDAQGNAVVDQKAWTAMLAAYDQKAPAPVAVKPQERSAVELAMGNVDKVADTRIDAPILRDFFNIAIKQGLLKREAFTTDKWSADYAPLIVTMLKVAGTLKQAWDQMLVPGKLVDKSLKFARLPGAQVASIKKAVDMFNAAQRAETATYAGYTKVNTAQVIEGINKTGVSTKKFNANGGAKELADAARTLLENTKVSVGGDLVKVDAAKNVFLKNEVLGVMLGAGLEAGKRLAASEAYRKSMVNEALKASSASVTIDQVQQAFMETVSAGKAGSNKKLYAAVKRTGAFDNATRAAYTELARTLTIGPAVLQFEKLLKEQLGPKFKVDLVEKVRNDVWDEFLTKAVSKTSIAIMPVIASGVVAASNAYTGRVSASTDARTKAAELSKALATAVKQSNSIISILDVQQGLLQMVGLKEISKTAASVKITGVADATTREGLFELSGMIFPKGFNIPQTLWQQYTDAVGIRVASATSVQKGWNAANYVALPQAAATLLSERAGGWIAKHGLSVYANNLAPVPLQNQDLQLRFDKPSVVTVKAPSKTVAFDDTAEKNLAAKKAVKKVKDLAAYRARKKAQAAVKLAAENPTNAPAQAAAKTAIMAATKAETEAVLADRSTAAQQTADGGQATGGQAGGGQAAGGEAGGGQGGSVGPISINIPGGGSFTTPGEPTPTSTPAPATAPEPAAEPVAPIQAGMGSSWLLMSAFGLGALFFLKDDKKKPKNVNRPLQRTAVRGR